MANNYVKVDTTKRLGWELQKCADLLSQAKAHIEQVKNVMANMTDNVTFTTIEAEFGLPSGKGQVTYQTVVNADTAMDSSADIQNIINCLGGITG